MAEKRARYYVFTGISLYSVVDRTTGTAVKGGIEHETDAVKLADKLNTKAGG